MRGGLVALVLVVGSVLAAACGTAEEPGPPHAWTVAFPAFATVQALPLTVADRTGLVLEAETASGFASFQPGAQTMAGRPNAIAVGWLGGMCDERASLTLTRAARWRIDIETQSANACRLAAISRMVVLVTREPIDPGAVDVFTNGQPLRR